MEMIADLTSINYLRQIEEIDTRCLAEICDKAVENDGAGVSRNELKNVFDRLLAIKGSEKIESNSLVTEKVTSDNRHPNPQVSSGEDTGFTDKKGREEVFPMQAHKEEVAHAQQTGTNGLSSPVSSSPTAPKIQVVWNNEQDAELLYDKSGAGEGCAWIRLKNVNADLITAELSDLVIVSIGEN